MEKRVLLGFSGGTDSSFAAVKLKSEGWEVTALTIDTHGDSKMLEGAHARASEFAIKHIVIDAREDFRRNIIDHFLSEYSSGRTPSPCAECNESIKWKYLYDYSVSNDIPYIATGHYFGITERNGRRFITTPSDINKDQTYYLWKLPQSVLQKILTPMTGVIKEDIMSSQGEKKAKESMGICFLRGEKCGSYLRRHLSDKLCEGDIRNTLGEIIGRHDGYPFYTIAQKKGLGLPPGLCITGIDPQTNTLTAGSPEELYYETLIVSGIRLNDPEEFFSLKDISVKIRGVGLNPTGHCILSESKGRLMVKLSDPAWAPAKGQPVVFYSGELLLGGGYLEEYF